MERFSRRWVCDACGTECVFVVTNDHNSLPKPKCCPYNVPGTDDYDDEVLPNWREDDGKEVASRRRSDEGVP